MTAMAASSSKTVSSWAFWLVVAMVVLVGPANAEEVQHCGWYQNPTLGNHFLTDADGEWVIGLQGGETAEGFDDLPASAFDFKGRWVEVNGYYGYGCACLRGAFGPAGSETVMSVREMRPLPLSRCEEYPKLPGLGG